MSSTTPSPAPKSPEQSEKSKKYDRQLRLWGDHGQSLLEESSVCLVNATAVGTELLKSLVLPGIGSFTIVDGKVATGEDVGSNFFLDVGSIGQPRGKEATERLLELNTDVRGDFINESAEHILRDNPDFFSNFSVVIANCLPERVLIVLAEKLWSQNIPLIVVRCYGLIGYIRIQIKEHFVWEAHPDAPILDLRLDKPFPEMEKYMQSQDLQTMNKKDHSHTPYLVILYKCLMEWLQTHIVPPTNYREKQEFKELIKTAILLNENGSPEDEENFHEALRAVNTSLSTTKIPESISAIFNDANCLNLNTKSHKFWILARAVKEFVNAEGEGALPLKGALPDMTSDTARYVALQKIFSEKANKDAELVYRRVRQLSSELGMNLELISESEVRKFCKHCRDIRVQHGTSIAAEYDINQANVQEIVSNLGNPDSEIAFYIIFRGVDRFYSEHGYYPGALSNDQMETDISKLKTCINKLVLEYNIPFAKDDLIHEICRFGSSELPSVAAFIGGCAAQESIKLITGQYVPIENVLIYNAMSSTTSSFKL